MRKNRIRFGRRQSSRNDPYDLTKAVSIIVSNVETIPDLASAPQGIVGAIGVHEVRPPDVMKHLPMKPRDYYCDASKIETLFWDDEVAYAVTPWLLVVARQNR